ncbi:MAG: YARHG domain-containing protein [Myxococcales bacterium]|nr:YARHG domain-containing protein [Myxococcales bacterium]
MCFCGASYAYKGPPLPRALRLLLSQQPAPYASLKDILINNALHSTWALRLDRADTRRLRNAIFALQGASFRSLDLQQFFAKQPWYRPYRSTQSITLAAIARENLRQLAVAEQQSLLPRPLDPPLSFVWETSVQIPFSQRALCQRALLHQARQWRYHHLAYFAFEKVRVLSYRRYLWAVIDLSDHMLHPLPPQSPQSPRPSFHKIPVAGGKALILGRSCTRWKVIAYGKGLLTQGLPPDLRQKLGLP